MNQVNFWIMDNNNIVLHNNIVMHQSVGFKLKEMEEDIITKIGPRSLSFWLLFVFNVKSGIGAL